MVFLKKYKFELALVALLITVSAVLINVLTTKKKEDDHGIIDGLRPAESYAQEEGDVPSDKFYEHSMMISKTDFEKYQVTTVGGKTVKAVLPVWECFEGYERGEPEPTIKLSVSKAVESDAYKGKKEGGYKYLSIYFAAENDYNLGYAWEITGNYYLTDHENGEDYMHKNYVDFEKENRIKKLICEEIIDVDQDTLGIITVTDGNEFAFSEPGEDTCIYMAPGDKITGKFVIKIEEDVLAAGRDYVLYANGSNRWMNMDFAVLIEQDKIEKAVNVE
ncbi:MAG: hypothetical protein ACLRLD_06570 [Lachnospira sp.]